MSRAVLNVCFKNAIKNSFYVYSNCYLFWEIIPHTAVILYDYRMSKKEKEEVRRSRPYWNFWKVVFAGWLIRYPRQCFTIIGVPLGFLIVLIYNAVTR